MVKQRRGGKGKGKRAKENHDYCKSAYCLLTKNTIIKLEITWEKLPDNFVLPDDPVDNITQPSLAAALTEKKVLILAADYLKML